MRQTWHQRLTQAREAAGLTKSELARKVGVKPPTVTDWESGEIRKIEAENLIRVCDALDVTPDWLMTGRERRRIGAGSEWELLVDTGTLPRETARKMERWAKAVAAGRMTWARFDSLTDSVLGAPESDPL